MEAECLLKITGLRHSYGAANVLDGVGFELKRGRIFGIVGENGAGKSTLVKCILNLIEPTSGTITHCGKVAAIHQEFNLIPDLNAYENIFLGRFLKNKFGFLNRTAMRRRTIDEFKKLRVSIDPDVNISNLSISERQMVEIAKAMATESQILIMDEPTTLLNRAETARLFEIMREFIAKDNAIIYISHKLFEVKEICNEIAVLRDGVLVDIFDASKAEAADIAQKMVGREFSGMFPEKALPPHNACEVLRVTSISSGKRVKDVSFEIMKGEIMGVAGLAGSGRSELAEAICGIEHVDSGTIVLDGKKVYFHAPADALNAGISYLAEDRQESAVLGEFSVAENISLSSIKKYLKFGFIRKKSIVSVAKVYIEKFGIKCCGSEDLLRNLSGGNQQKVAIAKGLDSDPKVFIFDEPTRGVDVSARRDIYEFIHQLASSGVACLMICSDLEELLGMCSRVMVMREGRTVGFLTGENMTEEDIIYLATGVCK